MKNNEFIWPIRVYYEDTDAGGVVYHSQYLNFMERARTEFLRELGYDQDVLVNDLGVLFVVRSVQLDYRKPARFNDALDVITSITQLGKASFSCQQAIYRSTGGTNERLTQATVKIACVNATRFNPIAIPEPIKEAFTR